MLRKTTRCQTPLPLVEVRASHTHAATQVHAGSRSFLEQGQLRRMHLRLSRFLRTVDYVVQTTLLSIALTSLERLRDTFDRALLLHVTPTSLAGSVVDTPERGSTPHSHSGSISFEEFEKGLSRITTKMGVEPVTPVSDVNRG